MVNSQDRQRVNQDCCVEEVGQVVQRLVRMMHLFERDQIRVFNFTASQCYTLLTVKKSGGLTMRELSDRMNLDSSTMTRVVTVLVRDGYLERHRSAEDRRIVTVALSERGQEAAARLEQSIEQYYLDTIKALPVDQVNNVLSAVTLLLNAFERANPSCC